jgi:hypothetical protein
MRNDEGVNNDNNDDERSCAWATAGHTWTCVLGEFMGGGRVVHISSVGLFSISIRLLHTHS